MTPNAIERPRLANPARSGRLTSLDGLRGVAALVVVLHHLYLVATPVITRQGGSGSGSLYWWLSQTPLKLLTAGTEGVLVFFVLSGLVVALPALERASFSWAGFFAARVVRLYLPVWVALAMGTALIWLLPRNSSMVTQGSWVESSNASSASAGYLLSQASLTRVSYGVDNVLWSLRWELIFSALLPAFILLARLLRRLWWPAFCLAFALTVTGALAQIDGLIYLPVFFMGTLMAFRLRSIRARIAELQNGSRGRRIGRFVFVGSLTLLISGWFTRGLAPSGSATNLVLSQLAVIGAAGLVLAALWVVGVRRLLDSRPCQWLGRVSFSLYLVHVPIIATLTFLVGDQNWPLVAGLTVPLALLSAWGFNILIEKPSHRLARRVSRWADRIAGWAMPKLHAAIERSERMSDDDRIPGVDVQATTTPLVSQLQHLR